jgi:hypothetical protein
LAPSGLLVYDRSLIAEPGGGVQGMSSKLTRERGLLSRVLAIFVLVLAAAPSLFAQNASACGAMDVVFVIDNTGSMAQVNDEIQDQVNAIADSVVTASGGD